MVLSSLGLQDILPIVEGNLAARSQAVRGATLKLLCCCPQPFLAQQGKAESSATAEPPRPSSIFPSLAQIENQVDPQKVTHVACFPPIVHGQRTHSTS